MLKFPKFWSSASTDVRFLKFLLFLCCTASETKLSYLHIDTVYFSIVHLYGRSFILCNYQIYLFIYFKCHGFRGFFKLTTVPWDICSTSEQMLGIKVPMHSCLLNGRNSRKTKNGLQYLWTVFRHVGMWYWVLPTLFASQPFLTYVWQHESSDERGQITEKKILFPSYVGIFHSLIH